MRPIACSLIVLAACSSEVDDGGLITPDGSTSHEDATTIADGSTENDAGIADSGEPPTTACDANAQPLAGGGVGGGPLAGSLQIFVFDGEDPLVAATVHVKTPSATLVALTDAAGCVQFRDASLTSTADVHIFAAD